MLVLSHWVNNPNPSFFSVRRGSKNLIETVRRGAKRLDRRERGEPREKDKKRLSLLLLSQPLPSKGCPLSAGSWSSLLRGSRIQQPNLKKGHKKALSRLELWSWPYYSKGKGLLKQVRRWKEYWQQLDQEREKKEEAHVAEQEKEYERELNDLWIRSFLPFSCSSYFLRGAKLLYLQERSALLFSLY